MAVDGALRTYCRAALAFRLIRHLEQAAETHSGRWLQLVRCVLDETKTAASLMQELAGQSALSVDVQQTSQFKDYLRGLAAMHTVAARVQVAATASFHSKQALQLGAAFDELEAMLAAPQNASLRSQLQMQAEFQTVAQCRWVRIHRPQPTSTVAPHAPKPSAESHAEQRILAERTNASVRNGVVYCVGGCQGEGAGGADSRLTALLQHQLAATATRFGGWIKGWVRALPALPCWLVCC